MTILEKGHIGKGQLSLLRTVIQDSLLLHMSLYVEYYPSYGNIDSGISIHILINSIKTDMTIMKKGII